MPVSLLRGRVDALIIILLISSLISGCAPSTNVVAGAPAASSTALLPTANSDLQQQNPTNPPAQATLTPTAAPAQPLLWVSPDLPEAFLALLSLPAALQTTSTRAEANMWIEIPSVDVYAKGAPATPAKEIANAQWVYALAAPFPTVVDAVSKEAIQAAWNGKANKTFNGAPLLMTAETRAALEAYWGPASPKEIRVAARETLLDTAWEEQTAWAVIPFEDIQPRWKILRVDGQSPLDSDFTAETYPLSIPIQVTGLYVDQESAMAISALPNNRDPRKLTSLVMTGVTALSRHIGERMETKGLTYPAEDIGELLAGADLTHISNEVSFYQKCPTPGPDRADMRFCSHPRYMALLEEVGADIIELTGNHILDWGWQPFLYSLELYEQHNMLTYGGGAKLADALQPLLVEHNGNRLAFLGCSPSGPENVWATNESPGSAPCVYERMEEQIRQLRADGYLPIVTLQAVETDTYAPPTAQGTPNFRRLARAGAVIVSGSQSHVPQTMTFVQASTGDEPPTSSFVHYGLGNLFFDQMKPEESRQEFIDQHVFYDGKYLGVTLHTALLEDYARPRPMTAPERSKFLEEIFRLSNWTAE